MTIQLSWEAIPSCSKAKKLAHGFRNRNAFISSAHLASYGVRSWRDIEDPTREAGLGDQLLEGSWLPHTG